MYNVTLRRVRATTVTVEKQIIITYSECVSLALGIRPATDVLYTVICGLPRSTTFFNITS
jgi:hypothetical protein